jgi:hypothetical protein
MRARHPDRLSGQLADAAPPAPSGRGSCLTGLGQPGKQALADKPPFLPEDPRSADRQAEGTYHESLEHTGERRNTRTKAGSALPPMINPG